MIKLLDLLKEDGQKTSTKNMDDYKKQNNPSGKIKDPLGLKAYAQELSRGLEEADPKKGTGKKPEGSGRRLYTDEDPTDTVRVKFKTAQDIKDTLSKTSFKSKSHARQSQVINLIHQRVRAAYNKAKDPEVKARLKRGLDYIEKRKEASKKKTQQLNKLKEFKDTNEINNFINSNQSRYRAIEKRGDKYYYIQDNPFSPGIRQEFGPYKTKEQAKKKMGTFPPSQNYRDLTQENIDEGDTYEKMVAKGKKSGNLKQGTVRTRLNIPKDEKIPMGKINKELSRLKKMDQDEDKKGVQLGDKNQKYYKALQLAKTLKSTTNLNEDNPKIKEILKHTLNYIKNYKSNKIKETSDPQSGKSSPYGSGYAPVKKEGTCGYNKDVKTNKKLNTPGGL